MAMKKKKLKIQKRPIRKKASEKLKQKRLTKKRRVQTKRANKAYYRKNRRTILQRGGARRARVKKGDKRSAYRKTI